MAVTTLHCLIFFLFLASTTSQFISPCPRLFQYESPGTENDRWYGKITLLSESELSGVWLHMIFDKPSIQIGNWFGEAIPRDNNAYLIKNPNQKLLPNVPIEIRFFVRYNPNETPPKLTTFRLNAKTVCPEGGAVTEASVTSGQLLTSSILSTTGNPLASGNSGVIDSINSNSNFPSSQPELPVSGVTSQKVPCGTVVTKPVSLISYGQNTTQGQWPWHAALYHVQGASLVYTCGGSLISENHILTAAHCVTKLHTTKSIDVTKLTVYLGKYNLKTFGAATQDVEISRIFIHPQYNPSNLFNDIAILKLKDSADITNFVRPVCLWDSGDSIAPVLNKLGTVVGWGFDENRKISESLLQAQMPVVSVTECIYSNREFFSHFTFEKNYCAGYRNGTTVCNGDSGGGMVFPKPGTKGANTVWQIRGLVSVGVALQDQGVCDPNHYTVFTDVAKHLDWIRGVMRQ